MKRTRTQWESSTTSPFAIYGTPLPLDSTTRDDGSFLPLWKQEVRDERGRKRLHGAFTGGFSAGYFNSVGSKEGWTPATFKSSRAERAGKREVRPEDFMDEEDLREQEEARVLETAKGFSGLGEEEGEGTGGRKMVTVMDLFMPREEEGMGMRLLKKMGWKEGQGVGPKVKRKARDEGGEAGDGRTFFFAPDDSQLIKFQRKTDSKGLGYDNADISLSRGHEHEEQRQAETKKKKKEKKAPKRTGFGVGVLNDDGEDDDDPYEIKPKSAYNRVIGGEEKKRVAVPKAPTRHVFVKKTGSSAKSGVDARKCNDGRLPLEGFVLASEAVEMNDSWYEPPVVPEDWFPTVLKESLDAEGQPQQSLKDLASASKLDPDARGRLLGEEKLPGKSIFDFLTPEARERLVAATGRTDLPPARGEKMINTPFDPHSLIPKIDTSVALSALNGGFMPYADDPAKRQRYRRYLELQAGLHAELPERLSGLSREDWIKELNEFAGAARIFKPMSGMMASRFTTSRSAASQITASADPSVREEDVLLHRPEKVEDPAEAAAKMGMYGPMTRKVEPFFPSRLLCKRFGVRPPITATEHEEGGTGKKGDEWKEKMGPAGASSYAAPPPVAKGPKTLLNDEELTQIMREAKGDGDYVLPEREAPVKVDVERNEALEGARAAEEVFKAIFGDSEDEEE